MKIYIFIIIYVYINGIKDCNIIIIYKVRMFSYFYTHFSLYYEYALYKSFIEYLIKVEEVLAFKVNTVKKVHSNGASS